MDADAILTRLLALLLEERDAIVRFDTAQVERFTGEKEALVAALRAGPPLSAGAASRCRALQEAVRQNLALLSHGRACLRDVVASLGRGGPRGGARPGLHVRVTG